MNQFIGAAWFRARPYDAIIGVQLLAAPSGDPSFPSDHATAAFCLAIGIGAASPTLRNVLLIEAILLVVARVAVGLHYPTDVLAGIVVAVASVTVAHAIIAVSRVPIAQLAGQILPLDIVKTVNRRHLRLPRDS